MNMPTMAKTISIVVALCFILSPRISVSHGVADVSLGAARICWAADGGEDSLWRQDHLLGSLSPIQVVCQIPQENRRKLAKVWLRASNIDGFSGTLGCLLESVHPVTNDIVRGAEIRPASGREVANVSLPVPRRGYRNGYWLVRCDLDGRSVLRGIRYIYR